MKWRNRPEAEGTWIKASDIQSVFPTDYMRCLERYKENRKKVKFELTNAPSPIREIEVTTSTPILTSKPLKTARMSTSGSMVRFFFF